MALIHHHRSFFFFFFWLQPPSHLVSPSLFFEFTLTKASSHPPVGPDKTHIIRQKVQTLSGPALEDRKRILFNSDEGDGSYDEFLRQKEVG
ncbi:hypothetical protein GGR50DRAFT_490611 [Xylaria sp. CBS 124048]|nr:hypothetical protein GGR50DRAFT_490611 [Xylaria sp. CBS 124048]